MGEVTRGVSGGAPIDGGVVENNDGEGLDGMLPVAKPQRGLFERALALSVGFEELDRGRNSGKQSYPGSIREAGPSYHLLSIGGEPRSPALSHDSSMITEDGSHVSEGRELIENSSGGSRSSDIIMIEGAPDPGRVNEKKKMTTTTTSTRKRPRPESDDTQDARATKHARTSEAAAIGKAIPQYDGANGDPLPPASSSKVSAVAAGVVGYRSPSRMIPVPVIVSPGFGIASPPPEVSSKPDVISAGLFDQEVVRLRPQSSPARQGPRAPQSGRSAQSLPPQWQANMDLAMTRVKEAIEKAKENEQQK